MSHGWLQGSRRGGKLQTSALWHHGATPHNTLIVQQSARMCPGLTFNMYTCMRSPAPTRPEAESQRARSTGASPCNHHDAVRRQAQLLRRKGVAGWRRLPSACGSGSTGTASVGQMASETKHNKTWRSLEGTCTGEAKVAGCQKARVRQQCHTEAATPGPWMPSSWQKAPSTAMPNGSAANSQLKSSQPASQSSGACPAFRTRPLDV